MIRPEGVSQAIRPRRWRMSPERTPSVAMAFHAEDEAEKSGIVLARRM